MKINYINLYVYLPKLGYNPEFLKKKRND